MTKGYTKLCCGLYRTASPFKNCLLQAEANTKIKKRELFSIERICSCIYVEIRDCISVCETYEDGIC